MTDTLPFSEHRRDLKPRITVIGVGGAGGNAVNNMVRDQLQGVKFLVANTDAQALEQSLAEVKMQLGLEVTQGLGAGSHPDVGRASAEESIDEVIAHLKGSNMLFVTAGMGGGTGTGAAPVIARAAREQGILTIGVVTKPFHFEGINRMKTAEKGIEDLQQYVDTLIIIPNQNLFRVANEKTTFADAFKMADEVLYSGVRSVTDLMMKPGLINLDFADVRAVMGGMMGKAMMGTGEAHGEGRAIEAAEAAISSPLLDDVSMRGARAVLINVTGGLDMTLFEVDEAANRIREEVDPDANIIFGSTFDENLQGKMRVSCVATGIDAQGNVFENANLMMGIETKDSLSFSIKETEFSSTSYDDFSFGEEKTVLDDDFQNEPSLGKEAQEASSEEVIHIDTVLNSQLQYKTENGQEINKPRSFFDRLIGRKAQIKQPQDMNAQHHDSKNTVSIDTVETSVGESDSDLLDIPAFLRRQANK